MLERATTITPLMVVALYARLIVVQALFFAQRVSRLFVGRVKVICVKWLEAVDLLANDPEVVVGVQDVGKQTFWAEIVQVTLRVAWLDAEWAFALLQAEVVFFEFFHAQYLGQKPANDYFNL